MAKTKKSVTGPSLFGVVPHQTETLAEIIADRDKNLINEIPVVPQVPVMPLGSVKLREGEILSIGDECIVIDDILFGLLKDAHKDKTFIIESMIPWKNCESGMLVTARQKDKPELKTTGIAGKGIDANWFKKITDNG